jgi:FtsP/CotA-like multicopper oxidase with cupredoxin domain
MGMYGVIVVLPKTVPANCSSGIHAKNDLARSTWDTKGDSAGPNGPDFRLARAATDHPASCYDREYLFQFAEIDPRVHAEADAQVTSKKGCTAGAMGCSLNVATEPFRPAYFLINGRSMPDDMDPNYAAEYPHQPYNGDPHVHPGELALIRVVGQGRWQHPFHEHANHVRILARDGNMILADPSEQGAMINYEGSAANAALALAGPALFTTSTVPGQSADGIFYFTGRGLNWDMYAHSSTSTDTNARLACTPDVNGYNTGDPTALNYYEWCQDHDKPLQANPLGDVAGGGPVTLPDPNILTNGAWFSGSPYLGPDATGRATGCLGTYGQNGSNASQTNPNCGTTATTPPSGTIANSPSSEAAFAYMWHSHNEREITTNNIFPGGMLMMLLVDSREFAIDETK